MGFTGGAAEAVERQPATAIIAGRYRCEATLGKGGAGQVYRVTDLVQGKELALKRLDRSANARLTALFELEYQTLASLKHPHIVEVYEFRRDPEGLFYTMELLAGGDLSDRAPMPWRDVCGYLRGAAQALGLLHARKLVHRDVSPRNLWRLPDGQVKLIDFGALAPFGSQGHLMGTPPFVPPEAFHGVSLDQRSDLYALGAVAYYLMTGFQAFPARHLRQLPELWQHRPPPPSQRVAELSRPDLDPVPPELDQLVADLLSQHMLTRPGSAAELIDRLDALLGTPASAESDGGVAHLSNGAFVGRVRERRRLRRQFLLATHGRGQSFVIESAAGQGRSRLLREFTLEAQVADAIVLPVDASSVSGLYGVATALAVKLCDALPEAARSAAQPFAASLARVSPRLREKLSVGALTGGDEAAGELRMRLQAALRDWFLAVAREHTLVVLVDGFELADDGSAAFLLALALGLGSSRLLLGCTLLVDRARELSASEQALRKASLTLALRPFEEAETVEVLQSFFGNAEHLPRLAACLHQVARGNPSHVLELTEQLVRDDVIGFAEGAWVLPQEVPREYLTSSRTQALATRLSVLNSGARRLGRVLSVHAGVLPLELCRALAASDAEELFSELGALLEAEILIGNDEGFRFAHEQHRLALQAELDAEPRRRAKRVLGEFLLNSPHVSVVERLRAGVHLIDSGDPRGSGIVAQASLRLALRESDQIVEAVPALEEALGRLRSQKRPPRELLSVIAPLALAGFYVHRRYAVRYADRALSLLEALLGLDRAHQLGRFLGRKLGLMTALLVAGAGFALRRKNPRVPTFPEALQLLFHAISTLAGSSVSTLDPDRAERYANLLEPLTALGEKRISAFIRDFGMALASTVRDSHSRALALWRPLVARLEKPDDVRGMPEHLRPRYLGGALFALGALQAQAEDPEALHTADRLEQLGLQLYRMSAEQVRTVYYAHQGDLELFRRHRERSEQLAIQQGAAWQIETWLPGSLSAFYLRVQDALGMKRTFEQMQRLGRDTPSLERHAGGFRGTYLLLRHRYADALPWLEGVRREQPLAHIGWAHDCGKLARAYNRLGAHERARAACLLALQHLTPEDLACTAHNAIVETELLVAEAGLGRREHAESELAKLLERQATKGPLTRGASYEAGVEIALLANDLARARVYFADMERLYRPIGAPGLAQRCEQLRARIEGTTAIAPAGRSSVLTTDTKNGPSGNTMLSVERILGGGSMSVEERARRALQVMAEHARCAEGLLYLLDEQARPRLSASLGGAEASPVLDSWIERRLASELEDESTQMASESGQVESEASEVFEQDGRHYRVHVLIASGAKAHGVMGAALLAAENAPPLPCPAEVLGSVGYYLHRALHHGASIESLT